MAGTRTATDLDPLAPGGVFLSDLGRDRLLRLLPQNGAVAEIGVYRGRFSKKILTRTHPKLLALVDHWSLGEPGGDFIPHSPSHSQRNIERIYRRLRRRMAWRFPHKRIEFVRADSAEAAGRFEDGFFDWVYIDGDHSYEGVARDLAAWAGKVKDDGLILGHDFTDHDGDGDGHPPYGVIRAVREFCEAGGGRLFLLTADPFPTFVILKSETGAARAFSERVIKASRRLIRASFDDFAQFRHTRFSGARIRRAHVFDFNPPA